MDEVLRMIEIIEDISVYGKIKVHKRAPKSA